MSARILRPAALLILTLAFLFAAGACSKEQNLPKDPNLELYINVSARCAYIDRAYANDPDLFRDELARVTFPSDWVALTDSLLAAYGSDPSFWFRVYTTIIEQSRK